MSTSNFNIKTHKIPCSHIREYPRALSTPDEPQIYLSVNQYTPKQHPTPPPSTPSVTLIVAQANAFPKELYEPFFDDFLQRTTTDPNPTYTISSIYIADVAHQSASYQLNSSHLGNDPSWHDHTRDLLHLVNLLRPPPPLIGIGHSMGGAQLVNLSLIHPRLFHSLILLDPVIQPRTTELQLSPDGSLQKIQTNLAALSTFRRDSWPSRAAAEQSFQKSPFYQSWDRRVFARWISHGLTSLPTPLHPNLKPDEVTLRTPVAMEVYQFSRPNFLGHGKRSGGKVDRTTHADVDPENANAWPFYRAEPNRTFLRLEEVRPSVLYVAGGASPVSQLIAGTAEAWRTRTGTGVGGSGGENEGRVRVVTLEGVGHLVVMEEEGLKGAVRAAGTWLGEEMERWRVEQESLKPWFEGSVSEKQAISDEWKQFMGGPPGRRQRNEKL